MTGPVKKLHYDRVETFVLALANTGPDAAWKPVVTLRGDAPAANVQATAPAGWTCGTDGGEQDFELTCRHAGALPAYALRTLQVELRIPARSNATQYLTLQASASTATPETQGANNQALYRNRIVGVP